MVRLSDWGSAFTGLKLLYVIGWYCKRVARSRSTRCCRSWNYFQWHILELKKNENAIFCYKPFTVYLRVTFVPDVSVVIRPVPALSFHRDKAFDTLNQLIDRLIVPWNHVHLISPPNRRFDALMLRLRFSKKSITNASKAGTLIDWILSAIVVNVQQKGFFEPQTESCFSWIEFSARSCSNFSDWIDCWAKNSDTCANLPSSSFRASWWYLAWMSSISVPSNFPRLEFFARSLSYRAWRSFKSFCALRRAFSSLRSLSLSCSISRRNWL